MKDNNKTNKMVTHWIHWDVFATASNIRPIVRIGNSRLGEKQERVSFFVQFCPSCCGWMFNFLGMLPVIGFLLSTFDCPLFGIFNIM